MSNKKPQQTVLIVDDQDNARKAIVRMLEVLKIETVEASSGREALKRLKAINPICMVLDADMPEMDGYQVVNQMIHDASIANCPVIFLTPNLSDGKQNLHRTILDVVDVLHKPVNEIALRRKVSVFMELNRHRDAIKSLNTDNEKLLEAMHEAVLGIDEKGLIRFVNSAAVRMLRTSASKLMDVYLETLLEEPNHQVDSNWEQHPIYTVCKSGNILQVERSEIWRADGTCFPVKLAAVPVNDIEGVSIIFAFKELVSEKDSRESFDKLNKLTNTDYLTGLPTRLRLEEAIEKGLEKIKRTHKHVAVMYVDLDHFKNINENLGHDLGDALLKAVAQRLKICIRKTDTLGRIGGDEFVIVLTCLDSPRSAAIVAQKIMSKLRSPFLQTGYEIFTGCSIGIANFPNSGDNPRTLLKNADSAAQRAKLLGRNNYQFYSAALNKERALQMELEHDLHHAVERRELTLEYAAIFDFKKQKNTGFDAQLTWHHPRRGRMEFSEVAELAEAAGLSVDILRWAWEEAFAQMRPQNGKKMLLRHTYLNLPISPSLLVSEGFIDWLNELLNVHDIHAHQLLVSVPESVLLSRAEDCDARLFELHKMGARLVLDNFGTGYAPLNLIKRTPFWALKVGRTFTAGIGENTADEAIIESVANLASKLSFHVWATGVENEMQIEFLTSANCSWGSGKIWASNIELASQEPKKLSKAGKTARSSMRLN